LRGRRFGSGPSTRGDRDYGNSGNLHGVTGYGDRERVSSPYCRGLATSYDESTWVLTSYLVAKAVVLPLSAWLSRVFGRKNYYMTCVALFSVSSLLCGLAPNLGALIFFRVLQGIGGGGLAPVEQAILVDTFPGHKRPAAFALYSMAIVTAPAIGPPLGGWITDSFSWRWVFLYQRTNRNLVADTHEPRCVGSTGVQGRG
jgi:MFS family permease